jgi:hypothetical protein
MRPHTRDSLQPEERLILHEAMIGQSICPKTSSERQTIMAMTLVQLALFGHWNPKDVHNHDDAFDRLGNRIVIGSISWRRSSSGVPGCFRVLCSSCSSSILSMTICPSPRSTPRSSGASYRVSMPASPAISRTHPD